jgi:hydrogenase maturation protease
MSVTVIGIGNTLMGDDGVGAVVARNVRARTSVDDVEVIESTTAGAGLLRYFTAAERVIVVDALDVGDVPGSVYRLDPDATGIGSLRSHNLHGMGVSYLIVNARLLGADPQVVVFGVQVGDVRPNADVLTPSVKEAASAVTEMVCRELALAATASS